MSATAWCSAVQKDIPQSDQKWGHQHSVTFLFYVQTIEAKLTLPSGGQFGTIVKTAYGPCKCDRKFALTCHLSESEKVQFDVEVLVSSSEFLVSFQACISYTFMLHPSVQTPAKLPNKNRNVLNLSSKNQSVKLCDKKPDYYSLSVLIACSKAFIHLLTYIT